MGPVPRAGRARNPVPTYLCLGTGAGVILDREQVRDLYRRTARFYDVALLPAKLLGLGMYRRRAVESLNLRSGDLVVDLCCGTGANFPLLHDRVGSEGRIVGVDLTDGMLEKARERVEKARLRNVELVESDVLDFRIPRGVAGVVATFALEMVPEYDTVIAGAAEAMPAGSRMALLGLKHPEGWPEWLIDLGVWLNRPFGASRDYGEFRPWISLRNHFTEIEHERMLADAAYLSVGEVAADEVEVSR